MMRLLVFAIAFFAFGCTDNKEKDYLDTGRQNLTNQARSKPGSIIECRVLSSGGKSYPGFYLVPFRIMINGSGPTGFCVRGKSAAKMRHN